MGILNTYQGEDQLVTTVKELMRTAAKCFVAKKGKKYIAAGGELYLTTSQLGAAAFRTSRELVKFLEVAAIDDRNADILGHSYVIVPLTRP